MINLEDMVVVFDLDDTLYPEEDYVISGIRYLEEFLTAIYENSIKEEILSAYLGGRKDFLEYTCKKLKLSKSSKESLLWAYRLHKPNIKLSNEIEDVLKFLKEMRSKVIILTDGRSITQRLKVHSLGLNKLPLYISEDYSSEKPNKKRFIQIQNDYPKKFYVYIADNPLKDFKAPLEMNWTCIGANWVKNKIHNFELSSMPKITLNCPLQIKEVLLKMNGIED